MGQDVRQDWAITLVAMNALLDRDYRGTGGNEERALVAIGGVYAALAFCGSFRGKKVFMVDLYGLRKY